MPCQVCNLRIYYVESIDPDGLWYARYSFSGGQPHHINRGKNTFEETAKIKNSIRKYANRFCLANNLNLIELTNTRSKQKELVKYRRRLIVNIKILMAVQNKHIASALGLTPATVSLALIKAGKPGKGES